MEGRTAQTRSRPDGFAFTAGCNSYVHSAIIPDSGYRWGVNVSHRGGIVQTRPGYRQRINCSQTVTTFPADYSTDGAGEPQLSALGYGGAVGFVPLKRTPAATPNLDHLWDNGTFPYVTEVPYPIPTHFTVPFNAPRAVPNVYFWPVGKLPTPTTNKFLFGENAQLLTIFKPGDASEELVWAVDGWVFVSKSNPDGTYQPPVRLYNIEFNSRARKVYSCQVVQSTQLGADGRVTVLPKPKTILVLQDGGLTRPAFYDGIDSGHLNPEPNWRIDTSGGPNDGSKIFSPLGNQVPLGSWMAWSGNRLWVAQDNKVYASDINNPLYFTEAQFLNEVPYFTYPDTVTGLFDRGSSTFSDSLLLVTTKNSTHSLNSGLTNRAGSPQEAGWLDSPGFNKTLFQGVGCVSGDTIVAQNGVIWWMSRDGVVKWDGGQTIAVTQELPIMSSAMSDSFMHIADGFFENACGVSHEHFLLWSVPSGDLLNRDTWVYDSQVLGPGSGSWAGVWRGTNPTQWVSGIIQGVRRCLFISKDCDGQIRIWEAFAPERADNGWPIRWSFESKTHLTGSLFDLGVIKNFWVSLMEVYGRVDLIGFWRGMRGPYKQNLVKRILATPGAQFIARNLPITNDTVFESYLPQSRIIKSQEISDTDPDCVGACGVESTLAEATDRGFSIQIVGEGRAAIEGYRINIAQTGQTSQGECEADEVGDRIVRACECSIAEPEPKLTFRGSWLAPSSYDRWSQVTYSGTGDTKWTALQPVPPGVIPEEGEYWTANITPVYRLSETNQHAAFTPIQPKACDVNFCSKADDPNVAGYPLIPTD